MKQFLLYLKGFFYSSSGDKKRKCFCVVSCAASSKLFQLLKLAELKRKMNIKHPKLWILLLKMLGCSLYSRLLASIIYLSNHVLSDVRCGAGAWCENPWQGSHDVLMTTGGRAGVRAHVDRMWTSPEEWGRYLEKQIVVPFNISLNIQFPQWQPRTSSTGWSSTFGYHSGHLDY